MILWLVCVSFFILYESTGTSLELPDQLSCFVILPQRGRIIVICCNQLVGTSSKNKEQVFFDLYVDMRLAHFMG